MSVNLEGQPSIMNETRRRPLMRIGQEFCLHGDTWRVTDVGTRTFLAINTTQGQLVRVSPGGEQTIHDVDPKAEGLLNGPPYAVVEQVWDEYDQQGLEDVEGLEWTKADLA
jgi:hypothetical protein